MPPTTPPTVLERILVVEDELSMRTIVADCLARRGYRVLSSADGEEGLRRALEEKPNLVLLDLMLPRLDGFTPFMEPVTVSTGSPGRLKPSLDHVGLEIASACEQTPPCAMSSALIPSRGDRH